MRPAIGRRRRAIRPAVALTVAALMAVAVGAVFGAVGTKTSASNTRAVSAAGVTVRVPSGWSALPPGSAIRHLFSGTVAGAAPPHAADSGILVGRSTAFGPDLLPGSFRNSVTVTGDGVPVRGRDSQGLLYRDITSSAGGRRIGLYAVPTTNDVVVVACYGAPALAACDAVAATLRISAGRPFPLGPRTPYTTRIEGILGRLVDRTRTRLNALYHAQGTAAQSAAAMRVADAYRSAAAQFSAFGYGTISPAEGGIHYLIRDSLLGVGRAYAALASAARRHDQTAYTAAINRVFTAVNQLGASLDQLGKLGYVISGAPVVVWQLGGHTTGALRPFTPPTTKLHVAFEAGQLPGLPPLARRSR